MADTGYDHTTGEVIEPSRNLPAPSEQGSSRNLIFASPDCAEIFGALCEFQGAVEPPKKTKTAKVKGTTKSGGAYDYEYNYAPLEEVHKAVQKPLAEAGLAHRQFLAIRDGQWVMRTIVAHKSGQWYGGDYPIFNGAQQGAQGFASGVTYARRYGLQLALGIVAEDDDDANAADGNVATVASGGRQTQGSAAPAAAGAGNGATAPQRASARPTAATATEQQQDATKRWRELVAEIEGNDSIADLDALVASPAWAAHTNIGREAFPDQIDGVVAKLHERVENRKRLLREQAGLPTEDGPRLPGEMG